MLERVLQNVFPATFVAWQGRAAWQMPRLAAVDLRHRHLGELVDHHRRGLTPSALSELERCLSNLWPAWGAAMGDQLRAVLADTEDAFESGLIELVGLDAFHGAGMLRAVGHPPGAPTPVFDCLVELPSGQSVPVDFKTASSSGLSNLQALLQAGATSWGRARGRRAGVSVEVKWSGSFGQEWVRLNATSIATQWQAFLGAASPRLPTTYVTMSFPEVDIEVRAVPVGGVRSSSGVGGVRSAALRASRTISKHASHKARSNIPFLLAYVARFGRPAGDLRSGVLHPAAIMAHRRESAPTSSSRQLWLGLLSIDLTRAQPSIRLLARYAANWPSGRADADALIARFGRLHTRYRAR